MPMSVPDWEDAAVVESWCAERRLDVARHLARQGLDHGRIGEGPAWHLAPLVSLWAIESKVAAGRVGWWVICGDLPTDYLSARGLRHPRRVLEEFARVWQHHRECVRSGAPHPETWIGDSGVTPKELVPLLERRARLLAECAGDDALWND